MNLPCPAESLRRTVTWADLQAVPIPLPVDSWWTFAIVSAALVLFIWVIVQLVSRRAGDTDPAETDRQMLTAISELRRRGDLSEEEFRSIKGQLVERLAGQPKSGSADSNTHPAKRTADKTSGTRQTEISSVGSVAVPTEHERLPADADSDPTSEAQTWHNAPG